MYLFLWHSLGSKLQKIHKISTKFASSFHNDINLNFMLQFPLSADLGLQIEKGNNLTFNVFKNKRKKKAPSEQLYII